MKDQNGKPITEKEFMEGESLRVEGECMTNNKHKEIIEKTLDKICEETSFIRGLDYDDEKLDYIGKCISSALTEQLEELERWVDSKRTYQHSKGGDEGWDKFKGDWDTFNESIGYHKALDDTLSHIREQKEIIKKQ